MRGGREGGRECMKRTYDIHVLTAPVYLALPGCVVSESTLPLFSIGNMRSCFLIMQLQRATTAWNLRLAAAASLPHAGRAQQANQHLPKQTKPILQRLNAIQRASSNPERSRTDPGPKQPLHRPTADNISQHVRKHQRHSKHLHNLRPQLGQKANQL